MTRQFSAAVLGALLALTPSLRAEGPDDRYIEIYRLIQEADRSAAGGQVQVAHRQYQDARAELKKLQDSYPNWNQKLVDYRLQMIDNKISAVSAAPAAPPTSPEVPPARGATREAPPRENAVQTPQRALPIQEPKTPLASSPPVQPVPDERDNQINQLQKQVQLLETGRSVLEAKLREALAAQPAALDPRELTRAEERIRALEKEREVLRVSVKLAEAKVAQPRESGTDEAKRALAAANEKLAQQNDAIIALRQEKAVLEKQLSQARSSDDDTLKNLRAENELLKKQLTEKPASDQSARGSDQTEKELASTKAALQSSRETLASLQGRVRSLEEDRDRLEKTRKELEARLASTAVANPTESAQVKRLEKERDDLKRQLSDNVKKLADNKSKTKQVRAQQPVDDVSALRARLEALEARRVPYSAEELALFKKPQDVAASVAPITEEQATNSISTAAGPLLAEAQHAFAARRFDEAEKKYREVLQMDDKNTATLQRLAAAQLEQNRPKDADATLKRALELNPTDARSLLLMGIAKFDQESYDDALDKLSRSAQIDPQNPETQNYLGITLSQKGQRAAAETALRRAIQIDPGYKSAHYNLAVVYATQQPPFIELARWHYQKALAYGHPASAELEKMIERKQAATPK